MFHRSVLLRSTRIALILATALFAFKAMPAAAGENKGTITAAKGTVTVKYAYFVKGPDSLDPKKIIRKIILTDQDLGAKITACTTMSCADSDLTSGLTVDLDGGPRLNFWMVMNGGLVQHSGTVEATALKLTADEAKRLAGKLSFDKTTSGGPKVDADFDATLLKEFTQAR